MEFVALQIVVPRTFTEFTSRRVLTTSWLEGEKLSGSKAADVGDLVNLGVICYLKQLLDTGFFHVRLPLSSHQHNQKIEPSMVILRTSRAVCIAVAASQAQI